MSLVTSNLVSAAPNILGQFSGSGTLQSVGCTTPSFNQTVTRTITLNITSQVAGTGGTDTFSGVASETAHIFWNDPPENFTGTIDATGNWTVNTAGGDTLSGTFSNGTIFWAGATGTIPDEPYASDGCTINEGAIAAVGGVNSTAAIAADVSAGTEIVTSNTESLQTFVSTNVTPIVDRLGSVMMALQHSSLESGYSGNIKKLSNGIRLEGQTGRSAGDNLNNLSFWGNISKVQIENDGDIVPYDGDQYALQVGMDFLPTEQMVLGMNLGYEDIDVSTKFNGGNLSGDGFTFSPYFGVVFDESWSLDALVGYSNMDYSQYRMLKNSTNRINGDTESDRYFANVNVNYNYFIEDKWLVYASGGLLWARETQEGFVESDGTINPERQAELTQGQIGIDFSYLAMESIEPFFGATYNYDFHSESVDVISQAGQQVAFSDNDDILAKIGANFDINHQSTATMEYRKRLLRDDFQEDVLSASLRLMF